MSNPRDGRESIIIEHPRKLSLLASLVRPFSRFSKDRMHPGLYQAIAMVTQETDFGFLQIMETGPTPIDDFFAFMELSDEKTLVARIDHYHAPNSRECKYRATQKHLFLQPGYTVRMADLYFLNPDAIDYHRVASLKDVNIEGLV